MELGLKPDSLKGKQFIQLVNEIIGFPRHLSQHVGGFVISSGPLYELVPVENAAMPERTIIQWDKDDLESLGLLKVDVLSLACSAPSVDVFSLLRNTITGTIALPISPDYKMTLRSMACCKRPIRLGCFR
ncbi:DNA polymerase III alpha subunit [Vibrio ishigakensis]|uniref:DNA polymerase III alpha subunit n=1 Tax=Vibrio ishigakensis TaxID=1481914 RepID=A0A0B8QUF8_9VIBR|nr:DNA polymerase III alpha subunit [Vibrio ishigakensis]